MTGRSASRVDVVLEAAVFGTISDAPATTLGVIARLRHHRPDDIREAIWRLIDADVLRADWDGRLDLVDRPDPAPAIDPTQPPPLEPGSITAKLLHDVWAGERIVHRSLGSPLNAERPDAAYVAAVITAHLHQRLGYRIHLVAATKAGRAHLYRALRAAMGDTHIAVTGAGAKDLGEQARLSPADTPPAIRVRATHRKPDPTNGHVDLYVVVDGSRLDAVQFTTYMRSAPQLLVIDRSPILDDMALGDRERLEIPFDIAIAGG